MIDMTSLAKRASVSVSELKNDAERVHREVTQGGRVIAVRYGDREDMALVSLAELVDLAGERAELMQMVASLERLLAEQSGLPLLGGPEEDALVRRRLGDSRLPASEVLAEARALLGLD
jgi:hypothetical protein